eukprot:GDKI01038294.1.p2 GENE.GDKI01038294.1~~GDKI01038294.1.p2  ORF type:complete len:108 (+),score=49.98 GDKI01038294.1:222-545(+)
MQHVNTHAYKSSPNVVEGIHTYTNTHTRHTTRTGTKRLRSTQVFRRVPHLNTHAQAANITHTHTHTTPTVNLRHGLSRRGHTHTHTQDSSLQKCCIVTHTQRNVAAA